MTAKSQKHWSADPSDLLRVGSGFVLTGVDPSATPGYGKGKRDAAGDLLAGAEQLDEYQERLYAASRVEATHASVLLVLQAMDSAGKGGIIRHVVGSVDPQGVTLTAFKKPTPEELAHDFLWRVRSRVPEPGFIGVFDRSHYEDVLIGKVRSLADPDEIERRYDAINAFEKELVDAGTRVVKVMLNISYEEQRSRLMERLDRPDKHWKFHVSDIDDRALWPAYQQAYEPALERCSTPHAPWYLVPADRKWYRNWAISRLLLEHLSELDPRYPKADFDVEEARRRLLEQ